MIRSIEAMGLGPEDFVLKVDAAGGAGYVANEARAYDGQSVIVLTGPARAHHGVTIGGHACTLVSDETSPLFFMGIGEILPGCVPHLRERGKAGGVAVVLIIRGKLPRRIYDILATRAAHVRIVYATGEQAPLHSVENEPPPGVQLPLLPRST